MTCRPVASADQQSITYVETAADATTAQRLGLANFSLTFVPTDVGWEIQLTNNATSANPSVTLNADQTAITSVSPSSYGTSAVPIYAYQTGPTTFFLSTNQGVVPNLTRGITWFLAVDTSGPLIIPQGTCPLNVAPLPQAGVSTYEGDGLSITLYAESSHDGFQLALARITINGQTDTFYNLPLPCVMSGPGCTLLSKSGQFPISFVTEYALLKFALAKVLFGCYSLCYLTQVYDQLILDRLQVEYPSFYARLITFEGYAELFIQSC